MPPARPVRCRQASSGAHLLRRTSITTTRTMMTVAAAPSAQIQADDVADLEAPPRQRPEEREGPPRRPR